MNFLNILKDNEKIYLKTKTFKKNEIILNEGDILNKMCFVLSGSISISTFTILNNEYNIRLLKENDSFGEFLIFSDKPYSLGTITALKETTIAFINKNDLIKIMQENEQFLLFFLNKMNNDALMLENRIKVLAQKSIKERILFYIKERSDSSNIIYITSKKDLAEYINIPRPSLSRELINLKDEGIIDFGRHYIKILKK